MSRHHILALAVLLTAGLIIAGCGGGGGGGGALPVTVEGRVIDSQLGAVSGVTVTAMTGGTRATFSDTTIANGWFEFADVPLGTPLNITVSGGSITTRTFNGVVLEGAGSGTKAYMDLFLAPTSVAPPAGSTVRVAPSLAKVTAGSQDFRASVTTEGIANPYYSYASWVITGDASGRIDSSDWMVCTVGAQQNGKAKIMAIVRLADGSLATDVLAVDTDMEGVEPPPLPF